MHNAYYLNVQCDWNLERLYASVAGASTFPDGPVVRLPENKTMKFPLQLFNHPLYRKAYNAAKQRLLEQYPTGELALPSCIQLP